MVAGAAAAVLLLAVVLGRAQQVQYADHHYTKSTLFLQDGGPKKAYDFARRQHDKRIGIAGSSEIFFGQYGFYGADLSNYVKYIGVPGPDGAYRLADHLPPVPRPDQRRRLRLPDHQPASPQDSPDSPYWYPIYAWVKSDPALKQVIAEPDITPQPDYVFKVNGKLDPAGCAKLGGAKS